MRSSLDFPFHSKSNQEGGAQHTLLYMMVSVLGFQSSKEVPQLSGIVRKGIPSDPYGRNQASPFLENGTSTHSVDNSMVYIRSAVGRNRIQEVSILFSVNMDIESQGPFVWCLKRGTRDRYQHLRDLPTQLCFAFGGALVYYMAFIFIFESYWLILLVKKSGKYMAGKMAQWLRVPSVLLEDNFGSQSLW